MADPRMHSGNALGAGHGGTGHGGYWSPPSTAQGIPNHAHAGPHTGGLASAAAALNAYAYANPAHTPPRTIEDAGIRTGEVIGYRCWKYRHGLLWSMATDYAWIPGEVVHGDPDKGVGVHAFKSLGHAVGQYAAHGGYGLQLVFGAVALWGTVIEHEIGWRGEYGAVEQITGLLPSDPKPSKFKFWQKQQNTMAAIRRKYRLEA